MSNFRELPYCMEAEQALIGVILLNPIRINEMLKNFIADCFYVEQHKIIYKKIIDISKNGELNVVSVIDSLQKDKQLDFCEGADYLYHLMRSVIATANIKVYMNVIYDNYILRKLIEHGNDAIELAHNTLGKNVNSIIEENISNLQNLKNNIDVTTDLIDDLNEVISLMASDTIKNNTITTGYHSLDRLGCFVKGELSVIGARPSMGKTAFVLNVCHQIMKHSSIIFFSLEMSKTQLLIRMLSNVSQVKKDTIEKSTYSENDFDKFTDAIELLKKYNDNLIIRDGKMLSISEITSTITSVNLDRIKNKKPLIDMIVIDYFSLLATDPQLMKQPEAMQLAENSKKLAKISKEMNLSVVLVAQLNRNCEARVNKKPMSSDLKGCGQLEQDADVVMLLYREDYYHKNEDGYEDNNHLDIFVEKNRNRKTGGAKLYFDMDTQSISNIFHDTKDFSYDKVGDK